MVTVVVVVVVVGVRTGSTRFMRRSSQVSRYKRGKKKIRGRKTEMLTFQGNSAWCRTQVLDQTPPTLHAGTMTIAHTGNLTTLPPPPPPPVGGADSTYEQPFPSTLSCGLNEEANCGFGYPRYASRIMHHAELSLALFRPVAIFYLWGPTIHPGWIAHPKTPPP